MKISKKWLSEYIAPLKSNDALEHNLTQLGLEVDTITKNKDDYIIDIEFTPNRGDCLSIYGTARDLAAYKKKDIKKPTCSKFTFTKTNERIKNINPSISPEYRYMELQNINVKTKTPKFITERLKQCDIASINIIVDISNYVMLEIGQPTHAFDLDKINGKLSIAKLEKKNKFTGIDNKDYIVEKGTEVIVDERNIIHALPGVIGSKISSVNTATKNILFESGFFLPDVVRALSRKFRIQTESSYRFERGVDYNLVELTLSRIHYLLSNTTNIDKCKITKISYKHTLTKLKSFDFDAKIYKRILGIDIDVREVKSILSNLGITFKAKKVIVPSYRFDISNNYDLVEEVSRIFGFDNIPELPLNTYYGKYHNKLNINEKLVILGYKEVINFTFISKNYSNDKKELKLENPISKEKSVMRESLIPGLISNIVYNANRQHKSIRLFERGKTYFKNKAKLLEPNTISGALYGNRSSTDLVSKSYEYGIGDLKSDILSLFPNISFEVNKESIYFDVNNSLRLLIDNKMIGECGLISPDLVKDFDIKGNIFAFEIIEDNLKQENKMTFTEVSQLPAVYKDITLITNIDNNILNIIDEIRKDSYKYMKNIRIKDIFINKDNLQSNNRNVTLEICLQSNSKTLSDKDISDDVNKVIEDLKNIHKIHIQEA
jgi:phenylalanyl-tRNA synthetase beta chain